ncbi:RtcB family protein [Patescibacteria group bacterium]
MSFSCNNITDPDIKAKLEQIANIKSLALPPICLPNIHKKPRLESPPQFVAATKKTIIPQLSAPAMNCGMCIFKTGLNKNDFTEDFLKEFASSLRTQVLPRITKVQSLFQWLGIFKRKKTKYDLTKKELESIFLHGASAAIKKYNISETELDNIERKGCILNKNEKDEINFYSLVPRSLYKNGLHEMGYNFGGNHFLEIHFIEKISNEKIAKLWGLKENQLVFFYHGGGGHATYHLGRYFARREKNTGFEKFALFFLKFFFHFCSFDGLKNFGTRWKAYFSKKQFSEISIETNEGKRLMQSIKISMNYGYAFRVALLKRIKDALPKTSEISFLWDSSHDSITEEEINGEKLIVHRQDAARIFPEKPAIISGFNTLSYIGIGTDRADKTIFSLSPSAGQTIKRFHKTGKSSAETTYKTLLTKHKEKDLVKIPQITSEGLFEITNIFEAEDVIKPVAYTRPVAIIKGH